MVFGIVGKQPARLFLGLGLNRSAQKAKTALRAAQMREHGFDPFTLFAQVIELANDGKKIAAIAAYRAETGADLIAAKGARAAANTTQTSKHCGLVVFLASEFDGYLAELIRGDRAAVDEPASFTSWAFVAKEDVIDEARQYGGQQFARLPR